jgi:hypothetical protein
MCRAQVVVQKQGPSAKTREMFMDEESDDDTKRTIKSDRQKKLDGMCLLCCLSLGYVFRSLTLPLW